MLAIVWLYQALRPLLFPPRPPQAPPRQAPPPPSTGAGNQAMQKSRFDDDGEYIDYEEVK
ncbi:MAG TPA: hypothetical protein PK228_20765 [Saprospiraceae bacterium]|nr:hypothetical protein [Saprospiraceae bacterium]